jgi:glycosidase
VGLRDQWYKNAIIYCLDVETYADSDGDGVGDFKGLTHRLDYLASLGVTCLWLMPFYPSPNCDDGYDVSDYTAIDPRFGSMADFSEFMVEARECGLHIIIDLVPNHTSDQHPWFQKARSDPDSPYRSYYIWRDDDPGDTSDNVVSPESRTESGHMTRWPTLGTSITSTGSSPISTSPTRMCAKSSARSSGSGCSKVSADSGSTRPHS